jgi:hypothetical protein
VYLDGADTALSYHVLEFPTLTVVGSGLVEFKGRPRAEEMATRLDRAVRLDIGRSQRVLGKLSDRERAAWNQLWQRQKLADSLRNDGAYDEAEDAYRTAGALYSATAWTPRLAVLVGVEHVKLLHNRFIARFLAGDAVGADSVFKRAQRLATDLLERYPKRIEPREARASLLYHHSVLTTEPTLQSLARAAEELQNLVGLPFGNTATAYVRLSGIRYLQGDYISSLSYADAAEKRDVFLTHENEILVRRFQAAFELADNVVADRACSDLNERFPLEWPAGACRLMLMGWGDSAQIDLQEARRIAAEGNRNDPLPYQPKSSNYLRGLLAAVLARAHQSAEARRLLESVDVSLDPELIALEAAAYALLEDWPRARAFASQYASRSEHAQLVIQRRRFYKALSTKSLD